MNLSPKQLKTLVLLSEGKTAKHIADKLEVTVQTISQWGKNPEFQIELNKLKQEILATAKDAIRSNVQVAINCLKSLVESGKNEEVRRKAANDLLAMSGIADPSDTRWGIGPTSLTALEQKRASEKHVGSLLRDLYKTG